MARTEDDLTMHDLSVTAVADLQPTLPRRIKRSHRKSRNGCEVCKLRRIKCDEVRPTCLKCSIRNIDCKYSQDVPKTSQRRSSADRTTGTKYDKSSWPTPTSLSSPGADQLQSPAGVSENELFRHYLSHTIQSIEKVNEGDVDTLDLWRVVIPALAYTSPPVRRGMLTLAALCLHFDNISHSPASCFKYREAAETHGEIFVESSRRQLQSIQASDINSVLICSRLLSVLGLAFYRIHRSNGVTFRDEAGWRWLHLLRGVLTAHAATESLGAVDPFIEKESKDIVAKDGKVGLDPHVPKTNAYSTHLLLPFIKQSQQERFTALLNELEWRTTSLDEQKYEDYAMAITALQALTTQICAGQVPNLPRAIYTWPITISKGFVVMLEQLDSFALAIYSHWLMLVILLDGVWFVDDMGCAGIREVMEICSGSGREVEGLLEFPRRALKYVYSR